MKAAGGSSIQDIMSGLSIRPASLSRRQLLLDGVETADVDRQDAVRPGRVEEACEAGAADDLVGLVGGAGVDPLGEGLVDSRQEDQELRVPRGEVVLAESPERALLVDRMDDRPGEGEEGDLVALQLQRQELPVAAAVQPDPAEQ